jgi:hypothetical protein
VQDYKDLKQILQKNYKMIVDGFKYYSANVPVGEV